MTPPLPPPSDADLLAIDRNLAGEMSPAEASEFVARLTADPTLAAHHAAQQRVTACLVAAYAPPPYQPPPAPKSAIPRTAWIAGALAVAVVATVCATRPWESSPPPSNDPRAAYELAQRDGFVPTFPESSPAALSETLSTKLGRDIRLQPAPGVQYVGLFMPPAGSGGSPLAVDLLAIVNGQRVVIAIDTAGMPAPTASAASAPFVHSRTSAGLRVTEVSASPTPLLLPMISVR